MSNLKTTSLVCIAILLSLSAFASAADPFRAFQIYGTGGAAAGPIAIADVNGDGKPDLLVGNIGTVNSLGSVGVLLGNGDGTFQPVKTYPVDGYNVLSLAVVDINKDGHPDVLVAQQAGVSILLGNGDGTFRVPTILPVPNLWTLAVADVNGDGNPDLVLAIGCGYPCVSPGTGVLLGKGDGTFGTLQRFSSYLVPFYVTAADVNHDGKLDLLIYGVALSSGDVKDRVGAFLGDGTGSFVWVNGFEGDGFGETALVPMAVADVNLDGNVDVITANDCVNNQCVQGDLGIFLGRGDGTLAPVIRIANTGGWRGGAVAVADINRDGVPDLLVSNMCNNFSECDYPTLGLLLGKGDGTFLPATGYNTGGVAGTYGQIAVADVNGDGTSDVFVTGGSGVTTGGGTVSVFLSLFDTTTSLTTSQNHTIYGQSVTLTATLATNGPAPPTGSVTFLAGKTQVGAAVLVGNTAILQDKVLPAGNLTITATYRGDTLSARSTSTALSQAVDKATTATTIESSLNPSTHGQTVKFTAAVTSPTVKVTGTVTFTAGSTTLGTVTLAGGKATISTTTLPVGSTKITAAYNGTTNITGSSVSLTQVVQ
jgi:hypothetical protein